MQKVITIAALPTGNLEASQSVHSNFITGIRAALEEADVMAIAIVFPPVGSDQHDWRKALVRDLARTYAPKRVNAVAGRPGPHIDDTIAFFRNAKGVTGHYCEVHEE